MEAAVRRYTRWPAVGQTNSLKRERVASKAAVSSSGRCTTVHVPSSWTESAPGGIARLPTGGLERCFQQASYQIAAVKTLRRLRARSISGVPRAVRDTVPALDALCPG